MKKQIRFWVGILASLLLTATLILTGCNTANKPAAPATSSSGSPSQVGITVHGYWVMDIVNPDGSIAEHREFENALTSLGGDTLAKVLSRQNSVGAWGIKLSCDSGAYPRGMIDYIVEPGATTYDSMVGGDFFTTDNDAFTLTVLHDTGRVILRGTSREALVDTNLTAVDTIIYRLPSSSAPVKDYLHEGYSQFTQYIFSGSLPHVVTGQTITLTVTITFS
jgi:hypothetical protein